MLSRVANSIYWMNRYIERAENVARFISVNLNLLLDFKNGRGGQWEPLIMATGDLESYQAQHDGFDQESVIRFLTFDRDYSNSIASCLSMARENGRSIREIISSEMWEHLNTFYLELTESKSQAFALEDPNRFFRIIQMRSHLYSGLLENTMNHDEGYCHARMGSLIERADKTSRILDVKYFMLLPNPDQVNSPIDSIQWSAVLKSVSAYEMYRKIHHNVTPKKVADFLIFNDAFPRSIRHCIDKSLEYLLKITGPSAGGLSSPAEKSLGRLKAELAYTEVDEAIRFGLHEYIDSLQSRLNQIDESIGNTFFNPKTIGGEGAQEQ